MADPDPTAGDNGEYTLADQVGVLAEVIQSFATSLNLQETLSNAISNFMVHMDAEAASIFLLNEEDSELVCQQCAGPVDISGLRIDANQGIVGKTVLEKRCQMVRDVRRESAFEASVDADTGFQTRSILCAPLVVRGTCIGALELINKKTGDGLFDGGDQHLVTTLASAAALAIHNARMAEALVEQERVRRELELVREVQVNLLPQPEGEHSPVVAVNIPAREVSGDFYDFLVVANGRIFFNLADVSGKGMNTALWMAKSSGLLRCLAKGAVDLGRLVAQVNDEVCETASHGMFVTLIAGFFEPATGAIEMVNAGHLPALYRTANGEFREIEAGGPPIGVVPGTAYPTTRFDLDGGSLYLYTDGVTEYADAEGGQLEIAGLKRLIQEMAHLVPRSRIEQLIAALHRSGQKQRDDITMMLIENAGQ